MERALAMGSRQSQTFGKPFQITALLSHNAGSMALPKASEIVTSGRSVKKYHGESVKREKRSQTSSRATNQSVVRTSPLQFLKIAEFGNVLNRILPIKEEKFVELKASVLICKKEYFDLPETEKVLDSLDNEDESLGRKVSLQLISVDADPSTGQGKLSCEMTIDNWEQTSPNHGLSSTNFINFELTFKVKRDFGLPGALRIRNLHREEFLLKAVTIELPDHSAVHFPCDSCVYNTKACNSDRIFFSNKVYLPHETPVGLRKLRNQELIKIRGDGTGERKEADRIYDYDTYNDLGDSDLHESLRRPVFGGNQEHPYPRRMRTGRNRSQTDPQAEQRGEQLASFYIPRDERFTMVKTDGFQEDAIKAASRKLVPALQALYSSQEEFDNLQEINDLFRKGVHLGVVPVLEPKSNTEAKVERVVHYPVPKVVAVDEKAWTLDVEFAREMLAGLNPLAIGCLKEFPITSKLDVASYGNPVSAITAVHIEPFMDGMDAPQALAEKKLFTLDYHDIYLPFINRINKNPTTQAYATRTILFLTKEGSLKPVAIELSLPPQHPGNENIRSVLTPPPMGTKDWVWEIAKAHVLSNDAGYHQLVSHWLRTHATIEPVVIATNRQLSSLHPVHQALVPHFKNTLDINAAARKALINAGGIIEKTFTPHQYAMHMSSAVYKQLWRFNEQALPADLIKRGMAIPDANSKHGIKLVIEDYPFAADGLELWGAIRSWLTNYINLCYLDDATVQSDVELQSWWTEIRTVGHGDKKDEEGWPILNSKEALIQVLSTIVWIASCHHAAVNFGQYEYAGYVPNHPTITRRLIPNKGTPEFLELQRDPEAFYLSTISNRTQATVIMTTTEVLSTHSSQEEYLGKRSTPNWTNDDKVLAVWSEFQESISEIEVLIQRRNQDKMLKNRYGSVELPYELLYPSSQSGLTGKGVPNSTSI